MSVCRYCGESAGWFKDAHETCVTSAHQGCEQVTSLIASTVATKLIPPKDHPDDDKWASEFVQHVWSDTKPQLDKLTTEHHIPPDDLRPAIRNGWSNGSEQAATAEPMHPDRLSVLNAFYRRIGFTDQEMRPTDGFVANVFSTLLWSVMVKGDPNLVANVPRHPFNLKEGEIPLFFFGSVVYSKETTSKSYEGGYGGMSVRLGHGMYYHFGGFKGQRLETAALKEIDYGGLLVTTQHLYFGGQHTNFRIAYEHVVTFRPLTSGIGAFRDSASAKAEVFTVLEANPSGGNPRNARPIFGWFLFNVAHFLAQPESRKLYGQAHR